MITYGLIGYPLGHSFSKRFFEEKFEAEGIRQHQYLNFPFEKIEDAVTCLKSTEGLRGFNVTIPFKRQIIPFLETLSAVVADIESCNCVRLIDGHWHGENTDVIGFEKSIVPLLESQHQSALVFGTGGASQSVVYVLRKLGISVTLVSRTGAPGSINYDEVRPEIVAAHKVLVNTTPVGMSPHSDQKLPLPYHAISGGHLAYDLIYNPEQTLFLKAASAMGATIKNGKDMLIIQAQESWRIWNS